MRLSKLFRKARSDHAPGTSGGARRGSSLGLGDWEGRWPEDDQPGRDLPEPEVEMMLNPGRPNIAPGGV